MTENIDTGTNGRLPVGFRRKHLWLVWLLFVIALALRGISLGSSPPPHTTEDEYFYLWSGMSMLRGEAPVAWSQLGVDSAEILGTSSKLAAGMKIVRPALDHPPVFSLMTGATAMLLGVKPVQEQLLKPESTMTLWDISLWRLRLLPLLLFAASFWLMWKWVGLVAGPAAAIVSVLFYSFVYTIVVHQRLVVADNVVAPLLILTAYTLEKWRLARITSVKAGTIVIVAVGLAIGSKLVAIAMVPMIVAWSAALYRGSQSLKPAMWALGGLCFGIAIVLSYAAMFGFNVFLETTRVQGSRFVDMGGLFDLIRHQPILHQDKFDPLIIGGWLLAFACAAALKSPVRATFAALVGYIFGYSFVAPTDAYGWYFLPVAPFLCAAWGIAVRNTLRNPGSAMGVLTVLLLATPLLAPFIETDRDLRLPARIIFLLLAVLTLLPWGFSTDGHRKSIIRWAVLWMVIINAGTEIYTLRISEW